MLDLADLERKIEATLYGIVQRVHNRIAQDGNQLFKEFTELGKIDNPQHFGDDTFFEELSGQFD